MAILHNMLMIGALAFVVLAYGDPTQQCGTTACIPGKTECKWNEIGEGSCIDIHPGAPNASSMTSSPLPESSLTATIQTSTPSPSNVLTSTVVSTSTIAVVVPSGSANSTIFLPTTTVTSTANSTESQTQTHTETHTESKTESKTDKASASGKSTSSSVAFAAATMVPAGGLAGLAVAAILGAL